MFPARAEEVTENARDRFRPEPSALVCSIHGGADLDLARIVSHEVHAKVANKQIRFLKSNREL